MERPASIELAIWINQFRIGNISATDATNAAETVTGVLKLVDEQGACGWLKIIEEVENAVTPVSALLPTSGNTYGLPITVIGKFDFSPGVLIINQRKIIGRSANSKDWIVEDITNPPVVLEPKSARQHLFDLTQLATTELSQLDLHGDRDPLDQELFQLRPIYLPPAISTRVKSDLEFAERIWLIAQFGINLSVAHASPSSDQRKISTLTQLKTAALELMAASSVAS